MKLKTIFLLITLLAFESLTLGNLIAQPYFSNSKNTVERNEALVAFQNDNNGTFLQVKPVLITYSKLTLSKWPINVSTWNFLALQSHLQLTGIPYEACSVEDLLNMDLSQFSVIIFIDSTYLNSTLFNQLYSKLKNYLSTGGNLISIGYPPVLDENDNYNDTILLNLFNVKNATYFPPQPFSILVGDLYTLRKSYSVNQTIWTFKGKYMDFISIEPANKANETYIIAWAKANNSFYPIAIANKYKSGKSAIFLVNVYSEWIDQTQLLLRVIQWCIFDNLPPVSLLISPGNITWLFTVDADLTSIPSITTEAVNRILNLSMNYRFTISWGIVAGPHPPGMSPDWDLLKPYFLRFIEYGHELASHSRSHPVWKELKADKTINLTARLIYELKGSKDDIENNLSVPIEVFHVPDGQFYVKWYPFLAEYYNLTITPGSDKSKLMGGFFFPEISGDKMIFWRTTYSDYEYFFLYNIPPEEALEMEMENFYYFYEFGRAIPYINLWHDYSITNDSLYPFLKEILKRQLIETPAVYSMLPLELIEKLRILRDIRYNVTYYDDRIRIDFSVKRIPAERRKFINNMVFLIELNNTIGEVLLNGKEHLAYQKDRVILFGISHEINFLEVIYSDIRKTHVMFTDVFLHSITISDDGSKYEILVTNSSKRFGRIEIWTLQEPQFVLINNTVYKIPLINNILVVNASTVEGPLNITLVYYGEIELVDIEKSTVYIPQNLTEGYPLRMYVKNTVSKSIYVIISTSLLKEQEVLATFYHKAQLKYGNRTEVNVYLNLTKLQDRLEEGNVTVVVRILSYDNKTIIDEEEYINAILIVDTTKGFRLILMTGTIIIIALSITLIYIMYRKKKKKEKELFGWIMEK
ncbi:MAG: hypothetical protein ABGF52_07240 [Candidatus Asgardarchaeum sp.]